MKTLRIRGLFLLSFVLFLSVILIVPGGAFAADADAHKGHEISQDRKSTRLNSTH